MTLRWHEITELLPELAEGVRARVESHRHKILATVRADGSPRVSGIESILFSGEDLWIGGMPGTLKFRDLRRDPRFALHSGTEDPPTTPSAGYPLDAKISGTVAEVTARDELPEALRAAPAGSFELFRVHVGELSLLRYGEPADHLVLDSWTARRGPRRDHLR